MKKEVKSGYERKVQLAILERMRCSVERTKDLKEREEYF